MTRPIRNADDVVRIIPANTTRIFHVPLRFEDQINGMDGEVAHNIEDLYVGSLRRNAIGTRGPEPLLAHRLLDDHQQERRIANAINVAAERGRFR